jgi:hypothetical protein
MIALVLALGAAWAAPSTLTWQGRLLDADGAPVHADTSVTIALYTQASGGAPVWSETDAVEVRDGFFTTELGDGTPLGGLDFAGTTYFVGLTPAGSAELAPRAELRAVPVALSVLGGPEAPAGPLQFGRAAFGHSVGWISFPRPFAVDPVFVATVMEIDDSGAVSTRVVQGGRSGVGLRAWDCGAANTPDSVGWLAIEPGVHAIDGHVIQAGNTGPTTGQSFLVTFPQPFTTTPVVLLDMDERGNDNGAVTCRIESLSATAVGGRCWSTTTLYDVDGLYWVAMEPTPAAGLAYGGRRIWAGHDNPATALFSVPLPTALPGAPEVAVMTIENFGTSGGPSEGRWNRATNGTQLTGNAWHCPSSEQRTPARLHWVAID